MRIDRDNTPVQPHENSTPPPETAAKAVHTLDKDFSAFSGSTSTKSAIDQSDLEKAAADSNGKYSKTEQAAAQYILQHQNFFDALTDGAGAGKPDGDIARTDLKKYAAVPTASSSAIVESGKSPQKTDTGFPDPSIVHDGKTYYAFATGMHYSTSTNPEGKWSQPKGLNIRKDKDGKLDLPDWLSRGELDSSWAPDVSKAPDGKGYIMYYAAPQGSGKNATHVLGYATASSPGGPWNFDHKKLDIPANASKGGVIDPSSFTDPKTGDHYIVYKNDGNHIGDTDTLWMQHVDSRGLPSGEPIATFGNGKPGGNALPGTKTVEAPQIVYDPRSKHYVEFYSEGGYKSDSGGKHKGYTSDYTEKYVTSKTLAGLATAKPNVLLKTGGTIAQNGHTIKLDGPGGAQVVSNGGEPGRSLVFHSYVVPAAGGDAYRALFAVPLRWTKSGEPYVEGYEPPK